MIEGLAVIAMFIITGILVIIWQNNEDRIRDISFKRFIEKKYSKSKSEDGDYIFVDPEKGQAYVQHRYSLATKLSPKVIQLMMPKKDVPKGNRLDYAIGRELTNLHQTDQELLADKAVTYNLTRDQVVKRKKLAEEISQEIEVLPEKTNEEKEFKQELEKEYLPRKFEGEPVVAEVRQKILKEMKLWVPTPKFEAELSPEMKKLVSMNRDYPNRTIVLSFDGKLVDIQKAKSELEKFLLEDGVTYFIFVAKV